MANAYMEARMVYKGKLVAATDGQVLLDDVWTPVESVLAPRWDRELVSRRLLLSKGNDSWTRQQMQAICEAYEGRGLTSKTEDPFKRAEELEEDAAIDL